MDCLAFLSPLLSVPYIFICSGDFLSSLLLFSIEKKDANDTNVDGLWPDARDLFIKDVVIEDVYIDCVGIEGNYLEGANTKDICSRNSDTRSAYIKGVYIESTYIVGSYAKSFWVKSAYTYINNTCIKA